MAFPNRFSGRCANPRCPEGRNRFDGVPSGTGFTIKNGSSYTTYCRTCCPERQEVAQPQQPNTLHVDGKLTWAYDANQLPLVRAFPGYKNSKDSSGKWQASVSVSQADLPRTLEVAEKLGFVVAPELVSACKTTEQAVVASHDPRLYPFQVKSVDHIARRQRSLIDSEMGLGKTVIALCSLPKNACEAVLVICPNSLKFNWKNEVARWAESYKTAVLSGKAGFRFPSKGEIAIVNYEVLQDVDSVPENLTVIIDEGSRCKNYKSKRSQRVQAICEKAKRVIVLDGTPLMNKPFDLWGVLCATGMAKEVFGSFGTFLRLFDASKNRWGGYEFGTPSVEVPERLRRVMIRHLRKDVLPDLPSKTYTDIVVNGVPASLQKRLDAINEEWADVLDADELPGFEEMSRVRSLLATSRIPAMLEQIESFEESETPLIVFSAYRAPIDELNSREGWATITGDTKPEDRQAIVDKFQAGNLKGVGLTIAAGGVGLTLTRAAHVLFVDLDWVPANNAQAEDRCILEGQPVLTTNGWKPVEEVQVGDSVIGHDGLPHKVIDAWNRQAKTSHKSKYIVELSMRGWKEPICMTNDHRVLTEDGWKEAGKIKPSQRIMMPSPVMNGNLSELLFDDDCRISAEFETESIIRSNGKPKKACVQANGRLVTMPEMMKLDSESMFVFGYYLGDGFSSVADNKGKFVSLSGNTTKKVPAMKRCRKWFDSLGVTTNEPSLTKDSQGTEQRIYSGELAYWFSKHFGRICKEKQIPEWVFQTSGEVRQAMADGMIASDGYVRPSKSGALRYEFTTTTPELASGFTRLLMGLGKKPCVKMFKKDRGLDFWRIGYTEGEKQSLVVSSVLIRLPKHGERVYDLTVAGSSSFVVGTSVVHNCCRIGSTADKIQIIRLVSDHPLDRHVQRLLISKAETARLSLDVEVRGPYADLAEKCGLVASAHPDVVWDKALELGFVFGPRIPSITTFDTKVANETEEQFELRMAKLRIASKEIETRRNLEAMEKIQAETRRCIETIAKRFKGVVPETVTPEQAEAIRGAFDQMVADDSDFAEHRNNVGFSKPDSYLARWLGRQLGTAQESTESLIGTWGILRKYSRQLSGRFPILFTWK